jgi:uracil-DNA glycosylase
MFGQQIWALLQERLFPIPSTATLFNPYASGRSQADLPGGDQIRRENLLSYLGTFRRPPSMMVVGEAFGWRGGRFSGVPFTSEAQLCRQRLPFPGHRSGRQAAPYGESSATIFWRHLAPFHPRFLAWNCIPLHPHKPGRPLSNRTPSRREIDAFAGLLAELLDRVHPRQVVALGRSAERALQQIGIPATYVRHPSHGGAAAFQAGIEALWGTSRPAA